MLSRMPPEIRLDRPDPVNVELTRFIYMMTSSAPDRSLTVFRPWPIFISPSRGMADNCSLM
ncbi:hypothetical protein D3C72_2377810 [compost metagenome]